MELSKKFADDEAVEFGPNKSARNTTRTENKAKDAGLKKMSSGNFGSEVENSARKVDDNVGLTSKE